ncbi:hypothetical protein TWF694_008226 [Orbilia ellipsospora]|uniref:Extracellular membrane protein CFEM domain-containing protein n=1 Tax=Orbilia ellipsospora TaxID=2528407 RepID=A0AAV9XFW2_9PEZI
MLFHSLRIQPFLSLCLLLSCHLAFVGAQSTALQSLWEIQDFVDQRECARPCFTTVNGLITRDIIGQANGCPGNPAQNKCFCRTDLTAQIVASLSSCVFKGCTSSALDVSSAISIYTEYCATALGDDTAPSTSTPAPKSTGTSQPPITDSDSQPTRTGSVFTSVQTVFSTVIVSQSGSQAASGSSQPGEFFRLLIIASIFLQVLLL